jgi:hypothetical protein
MIERESAGERGHAIRWCVRGEETGLEAQRQAHVIVRGCLLAHRTTFELLRRNRRRETAISSVSW